MKNRNTLIYTLLAVMLLVIPCSCTNKQVPILDMVVCLDNTDTIDHLSFDGIRPIFDFDRFLWFEHNTTFRELSDVDCGVSTSVRLPKGSSSEQTEQIRKAHVRSYLNQLENSFLQNEFQVGNRSESHIYIAVAQELNKLALQSQATNRVILISSDMHEHSALFSVYNSQDYDLLLNQPDSVIKRFNNAFPLPDLRGIQVEIIYRANTQTNEVFSHMARLYQMMLGLKGAQVYISGSFNPSDLITTKP